MKPTSNMESEMDILYVALSVTFWLLLVGLTRGLARLKGESA